MKIYSVEIIGVENSYIVRTVWTGTRVIIPRVGLAMRVILANMELMSGGAE